MYNVLSLALYILGTVAHPTNPKGTRVPENAIVVSKTGEGKYSTISAALKDTSSNVYYVYPGNYTEQVIIDRSNVTIIGYSSDTQDYTSNVVTISRNMPASIAGSNDLSGTVRILSTGAKLYHLNIENTYGKPVDQAQAIALSVQAGEFGSYGCQLRGFQDTLLANRGTQFYSHNLIQGSVDFIFGMYASIFITKSTINSVGTGYLTASGRQSDDENYYIIDRSTISGTGTTYLGRPWRSFARVVYQGTYISSIVPAVGWSIWNADDTRTSNVTYGEYDNFGPGAWKQGRATFATLLTKPISVQTALGANYTSWVDIAWL